jgi:hypothetical protein
MIASPVYIMCIIDKTIASISVKVITKLFQADLIKIARVYHKVIVSRIKKGEYDPGINISFSSSGSI